VRTFGVTFRSPQVFAYPAQGWDQLIYATRGVLTVHTTRGSWVLPAQRGLWVPAGVEHRIDIPGPVSLRSLYLVARLCRALPRDCCAVNVSPLLRELILYAVQLGALDRRVPEQRRLIAVILDQLKILDSIPLQLPMPAEPRSAKAAGLLLRDPAGSDSLETIAARVGASLRTLERLFRAETGMAVGDWRRRMRVLHALRLLAAGEPVTTVALETGYESTSAFISMFRRELGTTPSRYFAR
jgi:AraC-like DNA-binding protein